MRKSKGGILWILTVDKWKSFTFAVGIDIKRALRSRSSANEIWKISTNFKKGQNDKARVHRRGLIVLS